MACKSTTGGDSWNESKVNSLLIDKVDAQLMQTQCKECGYKDCLSYAKSIVEEQEETNKCLPGGKQVQENIAKILNTTIRLPTKPIPNPKVAFIDESQCIGCTKCIQACPIDTIIGTSKQMHSVYEKDCSGCELCIPACPVDCILLKPVETLLYDKNKAKQRYESKINRLKSKSAIKDIYKVSNNSSEVLNAKKDYIKNLIKK